jgi:alpha-glucosidase
MGTFGTGPFGSDDALDLLDQLADQPAGERCVILEQIFFQIQDHPDLLRWKFFPSKIVAAAAVVAASLPGGEPIREDLAALGYDPDAILIPAADRELNAGMPARQAAWVTLLPAPN